MKPNENHLMILMRISIIDKYKKLKTETWEEGRERKGEKGKIVKQESVTISNVHLFPWALSSLSSPSKVFKI